MTDSPENSTRTMRDTFRVWNFDAVEREVVLRSSDDQYVAISLPEDDANLFERLSDSSATVEATLVEADGTGPSWRLDAIHAVDEDA
ncbi:hypothetical protein [Halorussus salinisoli]|uniref:hypothetical protein n=1 Tax=Halorussus salinisoli TaxID=2558242 RepID=UPI0010C1E2FB|nr:hypothetical protein [Halorussus salinisoli]